MNIVTCRQRLLGVSLRTEDFWWGLAGSVDEGGLLPAVKVAAGAGANSGERLPGLAAALCHAAAAAAELHSLSRGAAGHAAGTAVPGRGRPGAPRRRRCLRGRQPAAAAAAAEQCARDAAGADRGGIAPARRGADSAAGAVAGAVAGAGGRGGVARVSARSAAACDISGRRRRPGAVQDDVAAAQDQPECVAQQPQHLVQGRGQSFWMIEV